MELDKQRDIKERLEEYLYGSTVNDKRHLRMKKLAIAHTEEHGELCKFCSERRCQLANPPYECSHIGKRISYDPDKDKLGIWEL